MRHLASRIAGSPRLQAALLGGFFFLNELGAYFTGVLAATLLVKRAGVACLPVVYLSMNLAFLPVSLMVMLRPPRSSRAMVKGTLAVYLLLLALAVPLSGSSSALILGVIYVVARQGKLVVTTFDASMVAETLPLRENKVATPRLLACQTAGLVAGGLLLEPLLALAGTTGTYLVLWIAIALAFALVALLDASCTPPSDALTEATGRDGEAEPGAVRATLAELAATPLARVMSAIAFFTISLRYVIEFAFSDAQARHFASETAMAAFAGSFEAGVATAVVLVQLWLVGPLMRRLKLGGVALVLPALMAATLPVACLSGTFHTVTATQFLFWLGFDGFSQPARQVMMGALPPASLARVPVLLTLSSILGSFAASALLVTLAGVGSPTPVLLVGWALSLAFLASTLPAGRVYARTLTSTLDRMDTVGRAEVLGALVAGEETDRSARLGALLASGDSELRLRAVEEAACQGPDASGLLAHRLAIEEDPRVLSALVAVLAPQRPPGLASALVRLLDVPDACVRASCIEGLGYAAHEPGVEALLSARLEAADAPAGAVHDRERAAAVIATVRFTAAARTLGRALDVLASMASDARPAARAAAAATMGRLGYPFFLDDLKRLLADRAVSVRSAALEALVELRMPSAARALSASLAVETDSEQRTRLERALRTLSDETVDAVAASLDALSGEERTQVRHVLAGAAGAGDVRLRVVRAALLLDDGELRAAVVRLARIGRDPALLAALERGLAVAGQLDLSPLLEHVGVRAGSVPVPYDALARLVGASTEASLAAHVQDVARRLWLNTAVAEALAARAGDDGARAAARHAVERQRALLDHLLAISGLATPAPDRALRLMRVALGDNRRASSLALEVLEDWLPGPVREPVFPVLECFGDPEGRRERAARITGLTGGEALGTACREVVS